MFWLFASSPATPTPEPTRTEGPLKNPNIPRLAEYGGQGSTEFWKQFPFNDIPSKPETKVITANLREVILENSKKLLKSELDRAEMFRVLRDRRPRIPKRTHRTLHCKKFEEIPGTWRISNGHYCILDNEEIRGGSIHQPTVTEVQSQLHLSSSSTNKDTDLYQRITTGRMKLQRQHRKNGTRKGQDVIS
jgi:hypothetical protein